MKTTQNGLMFNAILAFICVHKRKFREEEEAFVFDAHHTVMALGALEGGSSRE